MKALEKYNRIKLECLELERSINARLDEIQDIKDYILHKVGNRKSGEMTEAEERRYFRLSDERRELNNLRIALASAEYELEKGLENISL